MIGYSPTESKDNKYFFYEGKQVVKTILLLFLRSS